MHPLLRNVVIGLVGLIIAGALTALALLGRNSDLSILALLAAAILAALIGLFLYSQGWVWGSRAARRRQAGQSVLIAIGGGLMALIAAIALAGLLILLLLFFLG
jgi:putative flippase GtrA